jgi:predicted Zn-dependent peptidase
LEEAKEAYVNSFVFSFTSASSIVGRLMDLEYDGLPKDWLQQIRDKVVKLTKEDIQRAAKAHFNPSGCGFWPSDPVRPCRKCWPVSVR